MALGLGLGIQRDNKVSSDEAFSLTDIAGLQLWAKNKTGVTTGATLTWADQSGNGNDLTQAIANAQPAYSASTGSFDFTGSNNAAPIYMVQDSAVSLGAFTTFYVLDLNIPTAPAANIFFGFATLDADPLNNYIQFFGNSSAMYGYVRGGANTVADQVNALPLSNYPTNATKFVFTIRKDAASNATVSFKNNNSTMGSSTTFSSTATVDLDFLGFKQSGGRSLPGRCYEVAYYNQSLSDSDVDDVIGDLITRNSI
tara:strand:+ start:498 stop:1262 length:765 start_codon:yes stop_codon:yes gene_type:complete